MIFSMTAHVVVCYCASIAAPSPAVGAPAITAAVTLQLFGFPYTSWGPSQAQSARQALAVQVNTDPANVIITRVSDGNTGRQLLQSNHNAEVEQQDRSGNALPVGRMQLAGRRYSHSSLCAGQHKHVLSQFCVTWHDTAFVYGVTSEWAASESSACILAQFGSP